MVIYPLPRPVKWVILKNSAKNRVVQGNKPTFCDLSRVVQSNKPAFYDPAPTLTP